MISEEMIACFKDTIDESKTKEWCEWMTTLAKAKHVE
jgi:hypothetical protein